MNSVNLGKQAVKLPRQCKQRRAQCTQYNAASQALPAARAVGHGAQIKARAQGEVRDGVLGAGRCGALGARPWVRAAGGVLWGRGSGARTAPSSPTLTLSHR